MRESAKFKQEARKRRASRVRRRIHGNAERPRLSVFRSNRHICAQIIDDEMGQTLAAASSLKMEAPQDDEAKGKVAMAKAVGTLLAQRAQEKGIREVVFDRAGYRYHGRVAALADSVRKAGVKF